MRTSLIASSLLVAAAGTTVHANAFLLNEFDARAVGRGNAVSASDVDASSIYYNIGGLAVADGTRIVVGGSLIGPIASFKDSTGAVTDSNTSPQFIPGVFASSRVHDMVSVGLGFYTPFGLAISWPASSPQADLVREEVLHTFFITPSVGLNLDKQVPGLSFGAGLDLVPATVELKQDIFFGSDRGNAHLAATAFGIGGRFGVMYRPPALRQLSLGVMYRTDVKEDFSGTGRFEAPSPYRAQLPPDGDVRTSITLPQSVSGGVAYRPADNVELEADLVWTNWKKFSKLAIDVPSTTGMGSMTISSPRDYKNTTTLRIGGEYALPNYKTALRLGFIYDPTPIPTTRLTAELPDIDKYDVCAGGSYQLGKFDLHLGLIYVIKQTRQTAMDPGTPEYKGSFDVQAWVVSLGLSGKLGG